LGIALKIDMDKAKYIWKIWVARVKESRNREN
jgi:hypothetical protein